MERWHVTLLLLVGVFLVIGAILLRVLSNGKYEIKTTDLVFIVVPLVFAGLATGKLKGLDIFGVKADLSELWADAAGTHIEGQVSFVPASPVEDAVEMIETAPKRGVGDIPELIRKKTEALSFQLGMGGYYAPAIQKYFDDLYGSSYLRYVVIDNPDGTLFGMYKAADLIAYLRTIDGSGYDMFKDMLNDGGDRAKDALSKLPGFVSADLAVSGDTTKREALQRMEDLNLESLPVRDSAGRFVGTVERAKLTAGLILAVTEKLSAGGSGAVK